jgi:hypothetical protein
MNRRIFTLILGIAICGANPLFAMDTEELDIRAITPIKSGMNSEQQNEAIRLFLEESLKPEYEIKRADIVSMQTRSFGRRELEREFKIFTLKDGSEWVLGEGGLDRFLGYLYLKKAIEHYKLKTLCPVETRFLKRTAENREISTSVIPFTKKGFNPIYLIDSQDFFSLSRYVGDEEVTSETEDEENELRTLRRKIGFTDQNRENLRRKDGMIYILDTASTSFL